VLLDQAVQGRIAGEAAPAILERGLGGASVFYTFDPQANLAQRLDSTGTPLTTYLFDAFGLGHTAGSANSDPFGFGAQSGYYTDLETGLLLLTNRYYDPGTGRFATRDPIGTAGGMNLYGFVGNGPLSAADPSGLCGDDAPDADVEAYIQQFKAVTASSGAACAGSGTRCTPGSRSPLRSTR